MRGCPGCNAPLGRQVINTASLSQCPACNLWLRADVFPAVTRQPGNGENGDSLQTGKEASCFYHPRKKAVVACAACGRFLCALCDIDFNGRHLCPLCLEAGKTKRKIKNLEDQRICYDTIAWMVAFLPMLFFWFTIITAPIALFLVIRFWKSPLSIVPRTKVRFIAAFGLAAVQLTGWILFFVNLFVPST